MFFSRVLSLLCLFYLTACATLDMGVVSSLSRLEPTELDPKTARIAIFWPKAFTQHGMPSIDLTVKKDGTLLMEDNFRFVEDRASVKFVPAHRPDSGELIVYALDPAQYELAYKARNILLDAKETDRLFGGPGWYVYWYRNFKFTIEPSAYEAYCMRRVKLDISVWVKVNERSSFQRLVDEKGIDNFVSGQLKQECTNPDLVLITQ